MASFAIEAAGEASPLTEANLVNTIHAASSTNPLQVQSGTKQLAQWEKVPNFYRYLQDIYLNKTSPFEIRYLAIIALKNGIDKYWRKTAVNALSKEEKEIIRSRLAEGFLSEEDRRLVPMAGLVVAKIARYEYPNDWPDAISAFVQELRAPHARMGRAIQALLYIVKELSTGRLQRTKQYMQAATPEIVAVVGNIYVRELESWMNGLESNPDNMHHHEDSVSLAAIKLLRRLLVLGYEHPNRNADVVAFWNLSFDRLSAFVAIMMKKNKDGRFPESTMLAISKHAHQLAKLHHDMAKDHPAAFALMPASLHLIQRYWDVVKDFSKDFGVRNMKDATWEVGTESELHKPKSYIEKIALKALLILRACSKMIHNPAQTFKYRSPEDKDEKSRATELLRGTVFTETFIQDVMETTVTGYFVFRESDLQEWLEEPEEWEKREDGDGEDWEFSTRSCAEKLFLDLAINYKDMIVGPLLQAFEKAAVPDNDDILFKDSVYSAVGLSAAAIHQHLDFDRFINLVMVKEVQIQEPGYYILRRRFAILLGQWISVKISDQSKPIVYQIFQHLLNPDDSLNDQVVRVTAGRQFAKIADDWGFDAAIFMPYAQTILTQLMLLIGEVEQTETKMAILNTISVVVERLDSHITPFADRILTLLPPLWDQSGDEHLMKQAILTILTRLVNAMKTESLPLHSMVIPIIEGAVRPGSDTHVFLLEDALDLWHAVLMQTPDGSVSPNLFSLVQYLLPLFEHGTENLRKAFEIAESYLLVMPQHMLEDPIRSDVFRALGEILTGPKSDAHGLVCSFVEISFRLVHGEESSALPLGQHANASSLIIGTLASAQDPQTGNLGVFSTLLKGLRGSWAAHCTTGPNAQEAPVDGILETDYLAVFARAVLGSPDGFISTLQASAAALFGETDVSATLKWLLEEWTSHFENIGDPSRKKLTCLALTRLLETNLPIVLENLQSLMTIWTSMLLELREEEADIGSDTLVFKDQNAINEEYGPGTAEDVRRARLTTGDVVHTINLPQYIQYWLQHAVAATGGNDQFQQLWLVNVDKEVIDAFSKLGVM